MKKILLVILVLTSFHSFGQKDSSLNHKSKHSRQYAYAIGSIIGSSKAIGVSANLGFMAAKFLGIGAGIDPLSFNSSVFGSNASSQKITTIPIYFEIRIFAPTKQHLCPVLSFNYGTFSFDYKNKVPTDQYGYIQYNGVGKSTYGATLGFYVKNKRNPNKGVIVSAGYRYFDSILKSKIATAQYDNKGKYIGYELSNEETSVNGSYGTLSFGYKL